jgi:hypothetical protein
MTSRSNPWWPARETDGRTACSALQEYREALLEGGLILITETGLRLAATPQDPLNRAMNVDLGEAPPDVARRMAELIRKGVEAEKRGH